LVGGEIISLFAAAPLAVLAGVLWLRGSRLAPVLALAPALYAVYMYVQYILAPEYKRYQGNNEYFFPLYAVLIILSWALAVHSWATSGRMQLGLPSNGLRQALAGLLILLSTVFTLTWVASIAEVLGGGSVTEYEEHPTLFWLVRLMDLAFIIPVALITAWGLIRRAGWAVRLSYAVVGFQTLLVGAVAGMAWRDDPAADPVLLAVTMVITLALAVAYVLLLRGVPTEVRSRRGPAELP
jgi:hypothetical protein